MSRDFFPHTRFISTVLKIDARYHFRCRVIATENHGVTSWTGLVWHATHEHGMVLARMIPSRLQCLCHELIVGIHRSVAIARGRWKIVEEDSVPRILL